MCSIISKLVEKFAERKCTSKLLRKIMKKKLRDYDNIGIEKKDVKLRSFMFLIKIALVYCLRRKIFEGFESELLLNSKKLLQK